MLCLGLGARAARASGTETFLYLFKARPDGNLPVAPLLYASGSVYGTASTGGAPNDGTVFRIDSQGKEHVLYVFGTTYEDGDNPEAGLIDVGGLLYGTTFNGGAGGFGTVFSLDASGGHTVLHSFNSLIADGIQPSGDIAVLNGTLYGTTEAGGADNFGTVYALSLATGAETVLYSFTGGADGATPAAGLKLIGGVLYGTTESGGGSACLSATNQTVGCGTVFTISPAGTETVLHAFEGSDGQWPLGGVTLLSSHLYGATSRGGGNATGTVYAIAADGSAFATVHQFGDTGPYDPIGDLAVLSGALYGATSSGNIVAVTPAGGVTTIFSFTRKTGLAPESGPIVVDGALYGTTTFGGASNEGVVYGITP